MLFPSSPRRLFGRFAHTAAVDGHPVSHGAGIRHGFGVTGHRPVTDGIHSPVP